MMKKHSWRDLSRVQRSAILAAAAAEAVTTTAALVDLTRRPAADVRGPKALWLIGFVVQPFGPVAYWAVGRR